MPRICGAPCVSGNCDPLRIYVSAFFERFEQILLGTEVDAWAPGPELIFQTPPDPVRFWMSAGRVPVAANETVDDGPVMRDRIFAVHLFDRPCHDRLLDVVLSLYLTEQRLCVKKINGYL